MIGAMILSAAVFVLPFEDPQQQLPLPAPSPDPTSPGASPTAPPGSGQRYVFEVRDVQVEGLDWRGVLKGKARRLDWQSGSMVWAVNEETVKDLLNHVQKSPRSNLVQAPSAVAASGESARTMTGSTVQLVVDLERQGNEGPGPGQNAAAYQPILEQMHNGLDMALSATPTPEGLVVGVNLDETNLQGVHTGAFEDSIHSPSSTEEGPIKGLFKRFGEGNDPGVTKTGAMKLQASFQVPEIIRSHVEGAWTLKPGERVLISLGARSMPEKWGRSAVVERLVVITTRPETVADRTPGTLGKPASAPPPPPVPNSGVTPFPGPDAGGAAPPNLLEPAPPPPGIPGVLPDLNPSPAPIPR